MALYRKGLPVSWPRRRSTEYPCLWWFNSESRTEVGQVKQRGNKGLEKQNLTSNFVIFTSLYEKAFFFNRSITQCMGSDQVTQSWQIPVHKVSVRHSRCSRPNFLPPSKNKQTKRNWILKNLGGLCAPLNHLLLVSIHNLVAGPVIY